MQTSGTLLMREHCRLAAAADAAQLTPCLTCLPVRHSAVCSQPMHLLHVAEQYFAHITRCC
jgi:hypothetical protein